MCRRMPLLCMIGIVVGAVAVIHHLRADRARESMQAATVEPTSTQRDAATTLREMTHAPTPEKSWVIDGDQIDAETHLIVGHTRKPAVNESEALRDARRDVENRVLTAVNGAMHPNRVDLAMLRDRVVHDVSTGRFEIDRVAEKFNRPYGQVWTEAVLVDISPDKLNPALDQYRHDLQQNRNRVRGHWVGFAAIIVLALFGYTLSNAITRGYFTGRLRLMALLVVVLGAAALI